MGMAVAAVLLVPGAVAVLDRCSQNRCSPVTADALAGVKIPIAQVDGLAYGLCRDDRRGRIIPYDAFVSLKDQPGNTVVQVGADGSLDQTCARDGAELPRIAER